MTTVYYTPVNFDRYKHCNSPDYKRSSSSYAINFSLKPFIRVLIEDRKKTDTFVSCPAFLEFFKNTYVVSAPIDFEIEFNKQSFHFISPKASDNAHALDYLVQTTFNRTPEQPEGSNPLLSMAPAYLFYSFDDVIIEIHPPNLLSTAGLFSITPGSFNISKWFRPIDWTFEVNNPSKNLVIKRGDPLLLVKFIAKDGSKVELERVEENDQIETVVKSLVSTRDIFKKLTLNERYEMASDYIKLFFKNRKKTVQKCPFSYFRKG